jgi:hypothetical protein
MHDRQVHERAAPGDVVLGQVGNQGATDAWMGRPRVDGQCPQTAAVLGITESLLVVYAEGGGDDLRAIEVLGHQVGQEP